MKQMQVMIKHAHFVGIGGCGMSGIADVLLSKGYKVTGSDVKENKTTAYLRSRGAEIFIGHRAENIHGADFLVLSSAISKDNPELLAAEKTNTPKLARAEMLAQIMDDQKGIAIAGTHGKTTATSLLTSILRTADYDPTFLIGGTLQESGTNAQLGEGEYCVAEADESDASFLHLNPKIAVLTNIDLDHLWFYQSNFDVLKKTFINFLNRLPEDGLAVICNDDEVNRSILSEVQCPVITYGFEAGAQAQLSNFQQQGLKSQFQLKFANQSQALNIELNLPGKHNALNAAATAIVAHHIGVPDEAIIKALKLFSGVGRRFQNRGCIKIGDKPVLLIDDYGHHPREISATLAAAKAAWPDRRIVLCFQPHRYSRTKNLFDDFVTALSEADSLILLDVYAAGEARLPGADSKSLATAIKKKSSLPLIVHEHEKNFQKTLQENLQSDDVLIMQGAGDIGALAVELAKLQIS